MSWVSQSVCLVLRVRGYEPVIRHLGLCGGVWCVLSKEHFLTLGRALSSESLTPPPFISYAPRIARQFGPCPAAILGVLDDKQHLRRLLMLAGESGVSSPVQYAQDFARLSSADPPLGQSSQAKLRRLG